MCIFRTCYQTKLHDHSLRGASAVLTTQFRTDAMTVLLVAEANSKKLGVASGNLTVVPSFMDIRHVLHRLLKHGR
jgi:hypothetical protein